MNSIFIINRGEVVISPGKEVEKKTLTVKLEDAYEKLRGIVVSVASGILQAQVDPSQILVGSGREFILLSKASLDTALSSIKDGSICARVTAALHKHLTREAFVESIAAPDFAQTISMSSSPQSMSTSLSSSLVFAGIRPKSAPGRMCTAAREVEVLSELRARMYTLSCIMDVDKNLHIVAVRSVEEGSCKTILKSRSIWAKQMGSSFFPVGALLNGRVGVNPSSILREVGICQALIAANVPHIPYIYELPVRCSSRKVRLWMDYASNGDFSQYSLGHFDPFTGRVLDQFRKSHLLAMYYVAESLCAMHKKVGLIHGDIKMQNILVTNADPIDIRLSDFGSSGMIGAKRLDAPGSLPSPELVKEYETEKLLFSLEEQSLRVEELQKGTLLEVVKQMVAKVRLRCGVVLTPLWDTWAFGILLLRAMHGDNIHPNETLFRALYYDTSRDQIKLARDLILAKVLVVDDPIDRMIASLLGRNPQCRLTLEQVKSILETYLASCT